MLRTAAGVLPNGVLFDVLPAELLCAGVFRTDVLCGGMQSAGMLRAGHLMLSSPLRRHVCDGLPQLLCSARAVLLGRAIDRAVCCN